MLKKQIRFVVVAFLCMLFTATAFAKDIPTIRYGYAPGSNESSFIAAVMEGEKYVRDGYALKTLVPKEKYVFMKDGEPLANLDIVIGKGGADIAMLMGQGHVDFGTFSMSAVIPAVDQGINIKIISPYILATGGLVVHKNIPATTWDEMIAYNKQADNPLKLGYHSPTSAPIIITRGALESEGIIATDDPHETKADIVYVDLKGYPNLLPAMASGQVDIAVGPDPFPQLSEDHGYGRYLREFRKMPPNDKWADYPCCAVVATQNYIDKEPEIVQAMVNFLHASGTWCTENPEEAGKMVGGMLGLDDITSARLIPTYLNEFTDSWVEGAAFYVESFDKLGYLTGPLKGKKFTDIKDSFIDTQFVDSKASN